MGSFSVLRVSTLSTERTVLSAGAILLLSHVAAIAAWGTVKPGPIFSDAIQLCLGTLVIFSCLAAARRSEGLAHSFWRLTAAAYILWFVAQGLSIYTDYSHAVGGVQWVTNLLFCFWFVPLAMAMFLDPEQQSGHLDSLAALDFIQAVLVCVAAYLYFFYLPKSESPSELAHSVWEPYFIGYAFVAGAFMLRAISTSHRVPRALFGRFGALLFLSGLVDAMYYYGPGRDLKTGAWFDLLWSSMLLIPLTFAATWKQAEAPDLTIEAEQPEKKIHTDVFYLFYPLLVLFMSLRIARERLGLAAVVVFFSFVCSSARLLVTQHRLVRTQEALRREASRDSLTGIWNRKAILDILDRELLRGERNRIAVGVIMADVDHFKAVNDSRGHAAGDFVLRIIATEIAAVLRPYDSVGRYGGEEFLIVVPGCGLSETWELAERVRDCIANCSVIVGSNSVNVSLSLGIATANSSIDCEKLLHEADSALYHAKNAGRNCVQPTAGRAASGQGSLPTTQSKFWL
jgi:diguanylate cyclase (GGDEF)-like protein